MKKLLEYKDELHRCSQCGLCMSVCPLYAKTGNDCTNARGIVAILNGIMSGKLDFDETVIKYLELCLEQKNCDKCKNFCPSGIDLQKIFEIAYDDLQ
ncbi:(Fe-S)-binding protein [bacterium]|nr:(Fe-S)-binding protein [bacterium]